MKLIQIDIEVVDGEALLMDLDPIILRLDGYDNEREKCRAILSVLGSVVDRITEAMG